MLWKPRVRRDNLRFSLEKAKQLEKIPCMNDRLVLLCQRRYDIPDSHVLILGYTLWSQIPQDSVDIVRSKISDFQMIKEWSIEQHNQAHESDLTWLRGEIQTLREQEKRSILVVMHHAPSVQLREELVKLCVWDGLDIWTYTLYNRFKRREDYGSRICAALEIGKGEF
ncbi:uncharacterized protein N7500_007222 [Penicillium coprophilum]|uniref:uncharacterized protein n=1 Tax=Penicillium coprophilum TaxID=36646 RepID=UPI00238F6AB6|nr:uncharacterized protein N7500_007222 [Penicillium coprophilum]KAJ5165392.1 hypothetical protein N7500_007222 [Penicillium coprophilum]